MCFLDLCHGSRSCFDEDILAQNSCSQPRTTFVSYVHASFTGRDPHRILHRKVSSEVLRHESWYTRGSFDKVGHGKFGIAVLAWGYEGGVRARVCLMCTTCRFTIRTGVHGADFEDFDFRDTKDIV